MSKSGGNVEVELDLCNYAIKVDLLKKFDLLNLKSEIEKLDIGKLETAPVDLSKLCDVVKNEVVKKNEYNELVRKGNIIQTTDTSNLDN